jgi:hypothetical protein
MSKDQPLKYWIRDSKLALLNMTALNTCGRKRSGLKILRAFRLSAIFYGLTFPTIECYVLTNATPAYLFLEIQPIIPTATQLIAKVG